MWLVAHFWWWIQHVTGVDDATGRPYGFFSGIGSDLSELALLGAAIIAIRHLNCHIKHCWRHAKYAVDGTPYKVCKKHHPDTPKEDITVGHVHDMYNRIRRHNLTKEQ